MSDMHHPGYGPTMHDVYSIMEYLKRKYHAETQISIDNIANDTRNALLCITVISRCGVAHHPPAVFGWAGGLAPKRMSIVPKVLYEALGSLLEEVDGGCKHCQAEARRN